MLGVPVSGGISFGNAFLISDKQEISKNNIIKENIKVEIDRFLIGRDLAVITLEKLIKKIRNELGEDKAEIFEGHLEILSSDDVEEDVIKIISEQLVCADNAVEIFAEVNAKEMEELEDEYFRERGQDFRDIGRQLIKGIHGPEGDKKELPPRAVVIGEELTPSQTAALDLSRVKGFIVKEILRIPTSEGIRTRLNRFLNERDLLK